MKQQTPLSFDKTNWKKAETLFYLDKKKILRSVENKSNIYPTTKMILKLMAGGLFFAGCLVMPGLAVLLKDERKNFYYGEGWEPSKLKQTLKRLKQQKNIKLINTAEGFVVKITQKGMTRALKYKLEEMIVKPMRKWDNKWRIVIFDVPEKSKALRNFFRKRLKQLGFFRLQQSVFVHPYPCFDEIEFLRQIYAIGGNVTYILAERIEGQSDLIKHFHL